MPSDLPPTVSSPEPKSQGGEHWQRVLYMIGYAFVGYFVMIALFFLAVAQAGHLLITQRRWVEIETPARNLTRYLFEVMSFVSWASDDKPWPAQGSPADAAHSPKS
jgi:dolichyl-phosphate-mannose--protein O-mannosyl transferase